MASSYPRLTGREVDQADVLAPSDEAVIARGSARLEQSTGHQLVVVTVTSLGGRRIEEYAQGLGNYWHIGRRGVDDGVLVLVAPKEGQVRIATGDGVRDRLTDAEAADIIRNDMLPRFKLGEMRAGIYKGVVRIMAELDSSPGDYR